LPKSDPGARGVLQFNRVDNREGLFRSELGQQPLWLRALVVIGALALFAGIFWFTFRGTAWLKGDPTPPESTGEDVEGR
jgi:hypothetical protein